MEEENEVNPDQESAANLVDSGLTPLQLEMLAQRLSEYNNQIPQVPAAWDRLARNPEVKRQSRYRQYEQDTEPKLTINLDKPVLIRRTPMSYISLVPYGQLRPPAAVCH
ncbi:hypothetical protein ILUMI_23807 [Ignelater luminosus]|uniref:Uncharacterized protein n=1 Tax=Ignelater luminosus TaxID=2038154 RepID=A0A8K0CBS2_IGNLU|nr:hypothetical protein ILUMI_23807 [Ignelater luminosus]